MRSARAMPRQPLRRASRPLCAALLLIAGLCLGGAPASAEIELDPVIVFAGYTYRF